MTFTEILRACMARVPEDPVLRAAFDAVIFDRITPEKRAAAINAAGVERQIKALKALGCDDSTVVTALAQEFAVSPHALGERVTSPAVPVEAKAVPKPKAEPPPPVWKIRAGVRKATWDVLEIWDSEVPGLLQLMNADGGVDQVHGNWSDRFVRHGDDGGWCIQSGHRSRLHRYLERVRVAAGYPRSGRVFYLLVQKG